MAASYIACNSAVVYLPQVLAFHVSVEGTNFYVYSSLQIQAVAGQCWYSQVPRV